MSHLFNRFKIKTGSVLYLKDGDVEFYIIVGADYYKYFVCNFLVYKDRKFIDTFSHAIYKSRLKYVDIITDQKIIDAIIADSKNALGAVSPSDHHI